MIEFYVWGTLQAFYEAKAAFNAVAGHPAVEAGLFLINISSEITHRKITVEDRDAILVPMFFTEMSPEDAFNFEQTLWAHTEHGLKFTESEIVDA